MEKTRGEGPLCSKCRAVGCEPSVVAYSVTSHSRCHPSSLLCTTCTCRVAATWSLRRGKEGREADGGDREERSEEREEEQEETSKSEHFERKSEHYEDIAVS